MKSVRRCTDRRALLVLRHRLSHLAAFLRASAAGLCAGATVLHVRVPLAFLCARIAHLRAELTHCAGQFACACDVCRCCAADVSAIQIQCNTAGEHAHVFLAQACRSTLITSTRTVIAGLNATLHRFVTHRNLRSKVAGLGSGSSNPHSCGARIFPARSEL